VSKAFAEEVLATLRKNNSDITKPHDFKFYLYVPREDYARKVLTKVQQSGFAARLSRSGNHWLCVAEKALIPASADLADKSRFFEEIAAAVGGEFDGWEAEVVKPS